MNKLSLVLIPAGVIILLIPAIDGYFFQKVFYEQVGIIQQELQNDKNTKFQVDSYESGWLKSTANATITKTYPSREGSSISQSFHIQSIIHHGPLIFIHYAPHLAYAYIETVIPPPDAIKAFIPPEINIYLKIESLVSLNGSTWNNHYFVPPISYRGIAEWKGLTGDTLIRFNGYELERVSTQLTIGSLSVQSPSPVLPNISTQPIISSSQSLRQPSFLWNGNSTTVVPFVSISWTDGSVFNLKSMNTTASYGENGNGYSYNANLSIDSIQLPPPFPVTTLSRISYFFSINDFDIFSWFKTYKHSLELPAANTNFSANDLLKLFKPTSNANMRIYLESELGSLLATMNFSLISLPNTMEDLDSKINSSINIRIAQLFLNKLLTDYFVRNNQTVDKATSFLESMIQRGYLMRDQNDYVVTFSKIGPDSVLNSQHVTDEELKNIFGNIEQELKK